MNNLNESRSGWEHIDEIVSKVNNLAVEIKEGIHSSDRINFDFGRRFFERLANTLHDALRYLDAGKYEHFLHEITKVDKDIDRGYKMIDENLQLERKTFEAPSREIKYTRAANDELFEKLQNPQFLHALKKVHKNPLNDTNGELRANIQDSVVSLLDYRRKQMKVITSSDYEIHKAVEKIKMQGTISEMKGDFAIREAANDMFYDESKNNKTPPNPSMEKKPEGVNIKTKTSNEQKKEGLMRSFFNRLKKWF